MRARAFFCTDGESHSFAKCGTGNATKSCTTAFREPFAIDATRRPLIAAGGVTTQEEIDELDAMGVDAVVGMAIYTGALELKFKT